MSQKQIPERNVYRLTIGGVLDTIIVLALSTILKLWQ